jgi:cellulose synthase (UDP-forming)
VTAGTVAPRGRHHRKTGLLLPEPPDDHEKASYAWRSPPFLASALAISALCVIVLQAWMEISHPALAVFGWYTVILLAYQVLSMPGNFAGRSFHPTEHITRVRSWQPASWPDVDIYLPICGEPIQMLRNTWAGVFEVVHAYPGCARAFVLDDGPCDVARDVSASFGFSYFRRPDTRQHQKAGNLNHAFGRTSGPYLVVLDADCRPRADFLTETLPYLDDPTIGIVQTPQFRRLHPSQTWVASAAAPITDVFNRAQVSGDRSASALCIGSNAVYRRAALTPTGGFTLIPYGSDSHTGLDARYNGYRLKYLPVPLAAGICPESLDAFMRQQYRWCCGATSLIWTRHLWRIPMQRSGRLPYLAGWLANLMTGLRTLLLPLILVVLLASLPGEFRLLNAMLLVPAVLTAALQCPPRRNAPYSMRSWPLTLTLTLAAGWAQALAIWDFARGGVMSWTASRAHADVTGRFWWCVTIWNGGLALLWVALAAWRIAQTGSWRFAVVTALGMAYLATVAWLIFPSRRPA